nr:immunoglobulin heavy chain junction region [Mus musculus]
CARKGDFDYW